ncbi:DNA cytosine methyltransferase (plasmid) [Pseudomonas syringae]|uniref:DNA cytosine methyltransferase n=1 Tax=Pseudomonas syringae TaxID=317 RepID=UPI003F7A8B6A
MAITTVLNTKIGEARKVARLWLEGSKLANAGVKIGARYSIAAHRANNRIELREVDERYQGNTFTVSSRTLNGVVRPLFEIRTNVLREVFENVETVRVAIRDGRIVVTANHIISKIRERVSRLMTKLRDGAELAVCSLFHGGGVQDKSLHEGMNRAGIKSFVQVAVEQDSWYLDASLRNNTELWRAESVAICSDIRHVNWQHNPIACDVLALGLPCTGLSRSGIVKNKLTCGEEHSEAGALFVDFLDAVKAVNPAIVELECVPELQTSVSMIVIRSVLDSLGYDLHEAVLDGTDFGALERRKRFVAVAITRGLPAGFSLEALQPVKEKESSINDVLEPIAADSPLWKPYAHLEEKAVRDAEAKKGFAQRQLLTGREGYCKTIGRHYAKGRSTEPFLIHPTIPGLLRLFTATEHARIKGIPLSVIQGESETGAHEILGQSVIYPQFVSLGVVLGQYLRAIAANSNHFAEAA